MIPDLKIYKGREVEKVYHVEEIDLMFGVVEDIIDALNLDSLQSGSTKEILSAIIKAKGTLKPLLMDVFDGLTADEIRRTRSQNVSEVIIGIANYYFNDVFKINDERKN